MKFLALLLAAAVFPSLAANNPGTAKGQSFGNPAAPITIELYSDFGCPACQYYHQRFLPQLMRDFVSTGKVRLVVHDMANHPHSDEATAYALAAARIGKYTEVADALYQKQADWSATGKVWDVVAAVLSPADQKKVAAMAKEPAIVADVKAETDLGRIKAQRTPTMLVIRGIKQYPFESSPNWDLFRGFINDLLTK